MFKYNCKILLLVVFFWGCNQENKKVEDPYQNKQVSSKPELIASNISFKEIIDSLLNYDFSSQLENLLSRDTVLLKDITDLKDLKTQGDFFKIFYDREHERACLELDKLNSYNMKLYSSGLGTNYAIFNYQNTKLFIDYKNSINLAFVKDLSQQKYSYQVPAIFILNDSLKPFVGIKSKSLNNDTTIVELYDYQTVKNNDLYAQVIRFEDVDITRMSDLNIEKIKEIYRLVEEKKFKITNKVCFPNGSVFVKSYLWEDQACSLPFKKCF